MRAKRKDLRRHGVPCLYSCPRACGKSADRREPGL